MSESTLERAPSSGGNILTRKVGPLPLWGWMAIGLVAAIGFYLVQKNKAGGSGTPAPASSSGTTNANQVPQFVNQVYTSGSPPPAHKMPGGGTETPPPTGTPPGSTTSWNNPFIVAVPNGSGGWMEAVFPTSVAINNFYTDVGYNNGYPLGLNNSQISAAVHKAGGNVAGFVANSGPGGLVQ